MADALKAIETIYAGYRMRSRLEARWAVFLDALGVKWDYEREGFNLDGLLYLPDFYIQDFNCWIEIKGPYPTETEIEKCRRLAKASGQVVLLVTGDPWCEDDQNKYDVILFKPDDECGHFGTSGWQFGQGRRCSKEIWLVSDELGRAFALKAVTSWDEDPRPPVIGEDASSIRAAQKAARGARFEHGENPRIAGVPIYG